MASANVQRDDAASGEGLEFLDSLRQAHARQPLSDSGELGDPAKRGQLDGSFQPLSLTVAVSRESGSRGGTIARRAARKLGWQVYNQEILEYLAQERHLGRELFDTLDQRASAWVEERLQELLRAQNLSQNSSLIELARVVLAIGARGEAVILGRGSGCILPSASTLNVRIIAPLDQRISYMSQLERLTIEEATKQVRQRDRRRGEFIETHFHRRPADIYQYDLLVNSGMLGEDLSAQLIVRAVRARLAARNRERGLSGELAGEALV
jgi:cytidylate kinase